MSNNVQPLTTASGNKKSFLDLPAEIRNEIYNVALTKHEQVYITSRLMTGGPRDTFEAHGDATIEKPKLSASFLRVCRQVFDEATPILYGDNQFHFLFIRDLKMFLKIIGTSVRHLRNIKVITTENNKAVYKATMSRLKHAKGLNKLELPFPWQQDRLRRTADILRVLFQALHKARVQPTGTFPVLNILGFHNSVWPDVLFDEEGQKIQAAAYPEHCKSFTELLKHELQRFLK